MKISYLHERIYNDTIYQYEINMPFAWRWTELLWVVLLGIQFAQSLTRKQTKNDKQSSSIKSQRNRENLSPLKNKIYLRYVIIPLNFSENFKISLTFYWQLDKSKYSYQMSQIDNITLALNNYLSKNSKQNKIFKPKMLITISQWSIFLYIRGMVG